MMPKRIATIAFKDTEIQTTGGDWYLLRILPYRTAENWIDGLLITFFAIGRLKKAEQTAQETDIITAMVSRPPFLIGAG